METSQLTLPQLAAMIDYAYLKSQGLPRTLEQHCAEAAACGFAMVAIHPCDIERCLQLLSGTPVHVGAVVGFPLGFNTLAVKEYETKDAIQRGAHEIDMMINLRLLLDGDVRALDQEITSIVDICRSHQVVSKIILETCYLTDEQKRLVCRIALDAGANYVKTSTGFAPSGARAKDIRLMRAVVGERMGVKAAGGIRSLRDALEMIAAGANRLGTSHGVSIYTELKQRILALTEPQPAD